MYSSAAVDMYRYIQNNTDDCSIVAFGKPRSLLLNTNRVSFYIGRNGHTVEEADYYLYYKKGWFNKLQTEDEHLEEVYDNYGYTLYRILQ